MQDAGNMGNHRVFEATPPEQPAECQPEQRIEPDSAQNHNRSQRRECCNRWQVTRRGIETSTPRQAATYQSKTGTKLHQPRNQIARMSDHHKDWRRIAISYDRCTHTFISPCASPKPSSSGHEP